MRAKSILKRFLRRGMATVIIIVLLLLGGDYGLKKIATFLYPQKYSEYIEKYSAEYSVDENLCYAMIKCESNFKPDALSSAGAMGLMQMTDDTFSFITSKLYEEEIDKSYVYDPETNIKCGVWYIGYLKERFMFDREVIAAYNAGPNKVLSWLKDSNYSSDGKTLESLPYAETENHIKRVLRAKEIYEKLYKSEN